MSLQPRDLIASVVHDVDIKLRAEREIAKRIESSTATMRVLYHDVGMSAADIEDQVKAGLTAKGYSAEALKGAGVGAQRIYKLVGARR